MKFPKAVFFIISTEFCERFCYYGMRTILFLYLMEILRYSKETSTIIFHTYTMLIFVFPLVAAAAADSWLGKYRTILYFSIVYVIGQILLSVSSTPWFNFPIREMSIFGLFLMAVGTGGIKPCIAPFGGEQFKLPEQQAQLSTYFSVFYVSISCGALLSTFITPILRKNVNCFNLNSCYPLAFMAPSVLMIISLVLFIGGKRTYIMKKPEGNNLLKVMKCICYAIRRKVNSSEKRTHWLDYAEEAYGSKIIDDTKSLLRVIKLFIPMPIFWALYDQLGSRWTYQATRMDGEVFGYLIKPDQTVVFNAVLFTALVPVFHWIIYPIVERFLFINTPLRKISTSGILFVFAFVAAGLLELKLESTYEVQPSAGFAQIRIFNTINCPVDLSIDGQNYKLEALGFHKNLSVPVTGNASLNYDLNVTCPSTLPLTLAGSINVEEEKALSYLLRDDGLRINFFDKINKSGTSDPLVRALFLTDSGAPANVNLRLDSSNSYQLKLRGDKFFTNFIEINHNSYNISIDSIQVASNVSLRSGGVYTVMGRSLTDGTMVINVLTIVEPNSIHMVWLLPQYILIAFGEVMFFVNGQEFAYTQAPASMKSLIQAFWFLTSAFGNLIVVIITKANFFDRQVFEFFLYAGMQCTSVIFLSIMAVFYKYIDNSSKKNGVTNDMNLQSLPAKQGIVNEVFCEK